MSTAGDGTGLDHIAGLIEVGSVTTGIRCRPREAGAVVHCAVEVPTTDNSVDDAIGAGEECLTFSKRKGQAVVGG